MDSIQLTLQTVKRPKGFLKFVIPSVLSMVFMALYTIIDGIFVAHYSGTNALAAINIVLPLFSLAGGLGIMSASGGSALVGIALGAGQKEKANQLFSMILGATTVLGIALSVVTLLFLKPLLMLLGATPRLMADASIYGTMIALMIPVFIVKVLLEFFMRIDGQPNLSLVLSISGGVINMALDYLFMAIYGWGILGAALATAIGSVFSMGIGVWYFITKSNLRYHSTKWSLKTLWAVCFNGSSEMLTELSTGLTTFLFNVSALKMAGEEGLAALSVVMYTHFLLMSVCLGFSSGVAPLVSYAHGANEKDTMKKLSQRSLKYIALLSITMTLMAFFKSDMLTQLFIREEGIVFTMTTQAIQWFSLAFIFMGTNIFVSAKYTALNQGLKSAGVAFLRSLLGPVLGISLLPIILGIKGLWLVVPFAEGLTFMAVIYLTQKEKSHEGF